MNKPAYAAIQTHSPTKPVLVFVSSRRQTRLTALDIIAYAAADERPEAFVNMSEHEMSQALGVVQDPSLRHTLQFGIGMHHAGLCNDDRKLVEKLFVERKIQVGGSGQAMPSFVGKINVWNGKSCRLSSSRH
eukprot:scaffold122827_cov35-Prasinocladus_malaysianus.AAC.1